MRQGLPRMLLACLVALLLARHGLAADPEEELRQLFSEYIEAWNAADYTRIATRLYRTPVYIFDQQATAAFESPDQISDLLRGVRSELEAAGFSHSTLRDVGVCDLGGNLALATLHYSRFDRNGVPMGAEVLSSAYVARRTEAGWGLVAHIFQSRPGDVRCN